MDRGDVAGVDTLGAYLQTHLQATQAIFRWLK